MIKDSLFKVPDFLEDVIETSMYVSKNRVKSINCQCFEVKSAEKKTVFAGILCGRDE